MDYKLPNEYLEKQSLTVTFNVHIHVYDYNNSYATDIKLNECGLRIMPYMILLISKRKS